MFSLCIHLSQHYANKYSHIAININSGSGFLGIKGFLLGYMDYLFSFYVFHTKVGRYFMHSAMHSNKLVGAYTKFEICIFICLRWGSLDWYACTVELDRYNSYI